MNADATNSLHLPPCGGGRRAKRVGRGMPAESPLPPSPQGGGQERRRQQQQARQARRARLGGARQAGRHDLDPRGQRDQAPVLGQARRPCRHARPARLRLPADRARRGDQDRPVRDGRPQALPLHRALGRGTRYRRRRGPRHRHQRSAPLAGGRSAPLLPSYHRHHRAGAAALFGHQDRRASAPTTSPATARRWNSRPARSKSTGWS